MAGTNLGNAYVTIMPSAEGIQGSITSLLSGEADSAGKTTGNKLMGALKKTIAAAGIGKFFKESLLAGADLEQNLGGTKAVFGDFAESVQKTASTAYKNMGLSASDYMATANKMGSLFQGSGVTQERALKLTTDAMQRAADVASVMGVDTTFAMESIAGAAKGNFTMMDNLGVAMNATTLQAYALEKGINFKWDTASNAEKAELAMQMFMDRTQQYAGNFGHEVETTFSGSFAAMKAAFTDFIGNLSLGNDISGPLQNLMSSVKGFLIGNLLPMVGNILKALPTVLGTALSAAFSNLPGVVDAAVSFINNLASGLDGNSEGIISAMKAIGGKALEALLSVDWIGLGGALMNLLLSGLTAVGSMLGEMLVQIGSAAIEPLKMAWTTVVTSLSETWEAIKTGAVQTWEAIKTAVMTPVNAARTALQTAWASIRATASAAWNGIKATASAVWSAIKTAVTTPINTARTLVTSTINNLKIAMSSVFNSIKSTVTTIWNGIKTAMTKPIEAAKTTITGIINRIKGLFPISIGKIFSNIQLPKIDVTWTAGIGGIKIPHFNVAWHRKAYDTPYLFTSPTVVPTLSGLKGFGDGPGGEIVYGRNQLMRDIALATGGGGNYTFNIYAAEGQDPKSIAEEVEKILTRQAIQRRAAWA